MIVAQPLTIYIDAIPNTLEERRALRARAIDLRLRFRNLRDAAPTAVVLNLAIPATGSVQMVVVRPNSMVVGHVLESDAPIYAAHGQWVQHGRPIQVAEYQNPLVAIGHLRDTLRARLFALLPADHPARRLVERAIAAVVVSPTFHPDSRPGLDVDDHWALRKVLGIDELAGLMTMASAGVRLDEQHWQQLVDLLGGRLWHDGTRLLYELAPPRYCLRILVDGTPRRMVLPLLEGENIIGRRRTARPQDYRLTIAGDDLVSSDHALVLVGDDGQIILRDISKNGTWVAQSDGAERFLHAAEQPITPGMILRMGETRMRLEVLNG